MLSRIKHHRAVSLAAGALVVAAFVSGGTAVASADAQQTNNANAKGGVTNLNAGADYANTWSGDGGANMQTAIEHCPAGQYALGGGFSTWGGDRDLGGDNKNIQVTVSAPYFEGDYIPVNDAGNFLPTEWVIKGYNNGTTDQIVRAWVVCANVVD